MDPLHAPAPPLICKIKWVWGRRGSEFHAIIPAPDGSEAILARSPRFPWWLPVSPDATRRAVAAHETLVRQLLAAGWQPCGRGGLLNWYAGRFGASPRGPIEPLPALAPPLICEIKWVPGRGDGEFQAIVPAPDGGHVVLARSSRFRWRLPLMSPDATRGAVAAHEMLVRQLVAAGWQPCGGGLLNWYAGRFRAPETLAARPGTRTDG